MPKEYCVHTCLLLMESEEEIKPAFAFLLRRFVDTTISDSLMRKRLAGRDPVTYADLVSNEKFARVFGIVADDIEQSNKAHLVGYINKMDMPYVKSLNDLLEIVLVLRTTLMYIILCRKSYIVALEKSISESQKDHWGTQIKRSNKCIQKITTLLQTGTGEDMLELGNAEFYKSFFV